MGQILAVVDTDTGIRGYGIGGGGQAGIFIIENVLRPLIAGRDPRDAESAWEAMYLATRSFGRKGLVVMAMSAVDNALWDAWGKAEGVSVARLLGGPQCERIRCYATNPPPPEAVRLGFTAVKLHFTAPASESEAVERVAATRRLVGPEVDIFTDTHENWDAAATLRLAEAFAALKVGWIEEPLAADDLEAYRGLRRGSPVPIAGGEHEFTVWGFRELLAHEAHDIWQPDATWVGGMSQMKAIYALAKEAGVRVCPHRGAEVWGLHALAALDPQPLAESGRPWIDWLVGQPEISNGYIEVPDKPGFGVDVRPDLIGF